MTDDQQAQETPVSETPEAPMPSADQKTPDAGDGDRKDQPVETPAEGSLPDEAKERTRREFDKLQTQLREERTRRQYLEDVFQSQKPKGAPPLPPMFDPNTGLVNDQAISERDRMLLEANDRASRAEQAVAGYQLHTEEREMYAAFPELDPGSKGFDETFSHQVAALKLHSMVEPGVYGKQLSGKEAADYLRKNVMKKVEAAKQEGAKDALEQLTPREQAALEASGTPGRRTQAIDTAQLRERTRRGDMDALVERVKRQQG
jgi:hypothetical protein